MSQQPDTLQQILDASEKPQKPEMDMMQVIRECGITLEMDDRTTPRSESEKMEGTDGEHCKV